MENSKTIFKPIHFKNRIKPEPSFSDNFLQTTPPFSKILKDHKMEKMVQVKELTYPILMMEFYNNLLESA